MFTYARVCNTGTDKGMYKRFPNVFLVLDYLM